MSENPEKAKLLRTYCRIVTLFYTLDKHIYVILYCAFILPTVKIGKDKEGQKEQRYLKEKHVEWKFVLFWWVLRRTKTASAIQRQKYTFESANYMEEKQSYEAY